MSLHWILLTLLLCSREVLVNGYDIFSQLYYPSRANTLLEEEITNDIPVIVSRYSRHELRTRFTGNYNGSMYTSHEILGEEEKETDGDLSYETAIVKSGKRIVTYVGVEKKDEKKLQKSSLTSKWDKLSQKKKKRKKKKKRRVRRTVYGRDDRTFIPVNNHFGLKEPYIFTVRISTGCTGILISPRHVLTAAHCVHDQKDYVKQTKDLKIGLLKDKGSYEWLGVKSIKVSKGWIEGGHRNGPFYDYALLKLSRKHARPYIRISISEEKHHGTGERISFSGFDDDKPRGTMWYRSCTIVEDDRTFLYHYCDAQPGSSGSGVYSWIFDEETQQWQRELIGVFSGNRWRSYDEFYIRVKNFNVAVRLTRYKYAQICKWLGRKMAAKICKDKIKKKR